MVVPLALLAFLALPASGRNQVRASIGTRLEQCQNGTSGMALCAGNNWIRGDLNRNNSLYREGDFVPFRTPITSLVAGHKYTLTFGYDAVEHGLHAYDYLGSYNGSESGVDPCYGESVPGPPPCGGSPSTFEVPVDTDTTFPTGTSQAAGHFSMWGGTLSDAAYPAGQAPIGAGTTGTVKREITVTFTAHGDTVVLAWGGHIASTLDWGAGNTFVGSQSGASFHMRLVVIRDDTDNETTSTGNQELSLHGDALAPRPTPFTTQVDRSSVEVGSAVLDTATIGGRPGQPVSGVVNFFVCGPAPAAPNCTSGGNEVPEGGPGQIVTAPSPNSPDGVASVQFVPGEVGSYCFRAEYVPSDTAPYSPAAHTNTTTECFEAVITPPRLTVAKRCFPSDDPGRFNLRVDGVVDLPDAACGQSVGPLTVTAETPHIVSETAGTSTDLGNYTSEVGGNCSPNIGSSPPSGTITLANGVSATCVITNTRLGLMTGTLRLTKVCDPPTDPGRFELDIDSLQFADVPCGGSTGAVPVVPGPHAVSEPAGGTDTSLSNYTTVISGEGGDCADGSVTVAAGSAAECTFTNTRIPIPPATLTVTKQCVPGSGARFTITIDGEAIQTIGCGDSTQPKELAPGSHTVGETGANGTDVSDYTVVWGGDCQADGTVFIGAGAHAACTITNIRKPPPLPPMLTVLKLCAPSDDGGRFNLTINDQVSANQPCGGRFGPLVVSPGVNHVGETAGTRTSLSDYTSFIGGACAADGSVTVTAGQSSTCTITNVRSGENTAQITIVKQCRPAGVRNRFQLNLDDHVFQGMRCGQSTGPVVISTGAHSVGEVAVLALPGRFRAIITGDCSLHGAITLAPGQHATCTVTNVRRPLRPPPRPAPACHRLTVARRMVKVGNRVLVSGRVLLHRRPIQGVRVFAVGPGVFAVRTTDPRGRAVFLLRLHRPGILTLRIRRPFGCPKPAPKKIGILARIQPFLTG